MAAHKAALCSLARRIQGLDDELAELDRRIAVLIGSAAPELLARFGVGPDTAAALLVSCRRQPRASPLRSRLGPSVRSCPDPGFVGQEQPTPPRSWWGSPGQQRALAHRVGPHRP